MFVCNHIGIISDKRHGFRKIYCSPNALKLIEQLLQILCTIILEFNSAKKDDLRDLRAGEGKLFRKIQDTIDQLQEKGELGDCVQPVIVIVQQKKSDKGILD